MKAFKILNEMVGVEILDKNMNVIKSMTEEKVKELCLDDLILFIGKKPFRTTRLMNYIREAQAKASEKVGA